MQEKPLPACRCSPLGGRSAGAGVRAVPGRAGYQVQLSQVSERRIVYQSGAQGIAVLGESLALTPFTHDREVKQ